MSARAMELDVVIRLRDQLSAGIGNIEKKLQSMQNVAHRVTQGLDNMAGKLASAGVAAGVGMQAAVKNAISFDAELRDIAVTLDLSGKAAEDYIKKTGTALEQMTRAAGQRSQELAGSLGDLIRGGVEEAPAFKMIDQIGKVATASRAAVADLTTTAKVLFQNLNIDAGDMELALAKLHRAGKLGNFELRDMAKFLPEIAPNAAALGVTGFEAISSLGSALQISKMGTSTPGEAATNYKQFLSDMTSNHFKKRMEKEGIDLDTLVKDASMKGINPIEAVLQKMLKITNADKIAKEAGEEAKRRGLTDEQGQQLIIDRVAKALSGMKAGELLTNQQSKTFFAVFAANIEKYLDMKSQITAQGKDIISTDFKTQMSGPEVKARMAGEEIDQLMRRWGQSLTVMIDGFKWAGEAAVDLKNKFEGLIPGLIDPLLRLGSAIGMVLGVIGAYKIGSKFLSAGGTTAIAETVAASGDTARKAAEDLFKKPAGVGGAAAGGGLLLPSLARAAGSAGLAYTALELAGVATEYWAEKTGRPVVAPEDQSDRESAFSDWRARQRNRSGMPSQSTDVSGQITIRVEGPGTVTSITSDNPNVTLTPDRGAAVLRP